MTDEALKELIIDFVNSEEEREVLLIVLRLLSSKGAF